MRGKKCPIGTRGEITRRVKPLVAGTDKPEFSTGHHNPLWDNSLATVFLVNALEGLRGYHQSGVICSPNLLPQAIGPKGRRINVTGNVLNLSGFATTLWRYL